MGIVKKLGRPISGAGRTGSTRPIGHRAEGGGAGAESQIRQRQAPFSNDGSLQFQAAANAGFRADQVHGSSAGGTRPRAATAAAPRSAVMSQEQIMRGAGYQRKPGLANYTVHDVTKHEFGGAAEARANRNAPRFTAGRKRKPLIPQMSDSDFAEGAKLYRREHGNL